jgi:hypothetical protein
LLILIGLIIFVWLLIQTTPVQNLIVRQVTNKLSRDLKTTVRINHVDFNLFNTMLLQGTLVKDRRQDTLLYAGTVKVLITDWFFFKDQIELKYVGLKDAVIHLQRTDSIWNYQFLIDHFSRPSTTRQPSNVTLKLSRLELENVAVVQKDAWRGENLSAVVRTLNLDAEVFDLNKRVIGISKLTIDQPSFAIYNYTGKRLHPVVDTTEEEPIINDPNHLRWNPDNWQVTINKLTMTRGAFRSDQETDREPYQSFDGAHILFSEINGDFRDVKLRQDSITSDIVLSTKERSGFIVKKLSSKMRMHPEAMEFANLDLQTNRSHLQNFFAMRYETFDDMSDFETKVRMEGNFDNADVSSDDIAFFAPDLQTWQKRITITGNVKGSVDNLSAKNLKIQAGRDSYLHGNINIAGLPDIDKTFIDFEADDFMTIYSDAIAFVPQLRNIQQPRLDQLQYLRFRGNFTGFIRDFVTYGTLETRLGVIHSDLNMKLPRNGVARYSGTIGTTNFNLGQLIDNAQVGRTSFRGNINGSGFGPALNAKLDGNISLFEFKGYPYRNITVKGQVAKRLFDGDLVASDPNLDVQLHGLIDFSKKVPEFNFDAVVSRAALQELNLVNQNIEFNGKFRFNFRGNNIDNFLGTARIYDAALYKNGQRISFDSLSVESKILGTNRVITVLSNEFDAALVGEFTLQDLPASFQTFLNKYFPSYIKPVKGYQRNENFSFVITTKKVDDYISLINNNLSGFNYSTVTGRINARENLLDLNADFPEINYRNLKAQNVNLKAIGTYDSLVLETKVENIFINDSLHFPGTFIRVNSSNDVSDVTIKASANQTLNTASINARVQTIPKGVKVTFRQSSFEVNSKNWAIEKDGELVITEDMIMADGLKLYNGQQEIRVSTVPSDIGNTNDIRIDLTKINIGDFTPYLVRQNRIEGLLTGTITVMDPFRKLMIELNSEAEQFRFDDDSIGRIGLNANFNRRNGRVNFEVSSQNQHYEFDAQGLLKLRDSVTATEQLDINIGLNSTNIGLLERYLSGVFTNLDGQANGNLRIVGPVNNLKYLGNINLTNGGLRVLFTNVFYKIPSASFAFNEDHIDFGSFTIQDTLGNTGQITRGKLFHHGFNDLAFDFAMNSPKLLVLNTGNNGVDPYWGKVVARASMTLRGPLESMQMDISAAPADSSSLFINTRNSRESGQADFVVWKVYGREMQHVEAPRESNLNVHLDITANNYANVFVILDELTGDIIRTNGHGNLQINASTTGDFTITGRYDIDRGSYNFNFESLLRKPFTLREGAGNFIQWSGDPNNAIIRVDAEYTAENVRFSDLDLRGFEAQMFNNVRRYRGPVIVVASLTGELMRPTITFQIELPAGSPMKNDPGVVEVLRKIQSDENELNKQVAFLIVFNSFGPSSTQGNVANTAFEGLVVNSISGLLSSTLSREFSGILQNIFNDKSIHVNFNAQLYSGTQFVSDVNRNTFNIDRTNLNLSIGKSVWNDRLTFTFGSAVDFGLTPAQVDAAHSLPFLPDISAEWKIRPDGRLLLTFFYRDSYSFFTGSAARQNRSGASISYRHDFERLGTIFSGDDKKKKKKNVKTVAADGKDSTGSK